MKSGIYTITCLIDNKMYIGYTRDFSERFGNHRRTLNDNIHKNMHLQNAWNKYGSENFKFEILEQCERRFLASQEHYWVTILRTTDRKYGYNLNSTHPEGNFQASEETKKKLSSIRTGRKKTEEEKRKIGLGNKGKKHTPENLEKQRISHLGKTLPIETRRLISIAGRKRYHKPFDVFDLDGNLVNSFNNIMSAVEYFGFKKAAKNNIAANLNGIYNKTHGYIFKYKEVAIG